MSTTMTIDEAQAHLREVISQLGVGDEVAVTDGNQVVARIVGNVATHNPRPGPGLCKGMITIVEDDDEHLADFSEYMP